MLFVKPLTLEETTTLVEMHKNHQAQAPRARAQAVLLNAEGFKLSNIAEILMVCRQTVSTWLHTWEENGIRGLIDQPRPGRPHILSDAQEVEAIEAVKQSPRSLKKVIAQLSEKFNVNISLSTLKNICKRAGLSWKRMRKSLKSKRDPILFEECRKKLEILIEQDKEGIIDLYYFDETGFSLEPCVPYAWQPIGETVGIPSSKSKRMNVLGFINRECSFSSFVFEGTVTSSVVVGCIDKFSEGLQKPTTLIIDNASIHTSAEFLENIEHWKKRGLTIMPISPYSPELNIIEMLWNNIKYEWIPFSAYESFSNLKGSLFEILANIGKAYIVNFS